MKLKFCLSSKEDRDSLKKLLEEEAERERFAEESLCKFMRFYKTRWRRVALGFRLEAMAIRIVSFILSPNSLLDYLLRKKRPRLAAPLSSVSWLCVVLVLPSFGRAGEPSVLL